MGAPLLVLASASPRRRRLLGHLGVPFEARPAGVQEDDVEGEVPDRVLTLAHLKAAAVAAELDHGFVIGADTLGSLEGTPLAKPADEQEAMQMLWRLADRTHEVYTGVAVVRVQDGEPIAEASDVVCSKVTFRPLNVREIQEYVASGEYEDKAGGYAIQGAGRDLVARLEGSYTNVVGLPVGALADVLAGLGYPVPEVDVDALERRFDRSASPTADATRGAPA